jgi:hypothetical protein
MREFGLKNSLRMRVSATPAVTSISTPGVCRHRLLGTRHDKRRRPQRRCDLER